MTYPTIEECVFGALLLDIFVTFWLISQRRIIAAINTMEKRLMSQLDDLRQGEADVKQAISDAGGRVVAKLDAFQEKLDSQPLTAPVAEDLSADIQAMKDDVAALAKVGADAAPATPPAAIPVAVGTVIGIPTDPADPNSPTVDHTVTDIGADGTITAEPVQTDTTGDAAVQGA